MTNNDKELNWIIVGDRIALQMTTKEIVELYADDYGYTRSTPQQPQRQDSLTDQMETVKKLARNAGCHDALDWLNNNFGKPQQPSEEIHENKTCLKCGKDSMLVICDDCVKPSEKKALSRDGIKDILAIEFNKLHAKQDKAIKNGDWGVGGGWSMEIDNMFDAFAEAIESALPAQREVRYPDKRQCTCLGSGECVSCIKNQAIDEFKKLNGESV